MSSKVMFDLLTAFGSYALVGGVIGCVFGVYTHVPDVWVPGAGGAILGLLAQYTQHLMNEDATKKQAELQRQRGLSGLGLLSGRNALGLSAKAPTPPVDNPDPTTKRPDA
jgi:hypothetical protein